MPVNTLRRFKRHYKLQAKPGLTKAQLADVGLVAFTNIEFHLTKPIRTKIEY